LTSATPSVAAAAEQPHARSSTLSAEWRRAITAGIATLVVYKIASEVVALIAAYGASFPRQLNHDPGAALRVWAHWDVGWYTSIAKDGYLAWSHVLIPPGHYQNGAAFPPALPIGIRMVMTVSHRSALTSGLLVTTVALGIGLVGLYRLAALDFGDRVAAATLVLLLVFPASFFFNSVYSEALVLMGCVWAVLLTRLKLWPLAGLFAAVAVLAKIAAVLVLVLMLIEYNPPARRGWDRRFLEMGALFAPTIVALGGLSLYFLAREHNAFVYITANRDWSRSFQPMWQMAAGAVGNVLALKTFDELHGLVTFLDVVSLFLLIAMTVYTWFRVRRSYAVFMALVTFSVGSAGYIESTTRHVLLAFPIFIAAAVLVNARPWLDRAVMVISAPAWAYILARFATGGWAG